MTENYLPKAISVLVLYHAAEDRLALITTAADSSKTVMTVTRRLTSRLLNGFAHLLERTSSAAQEAPQRARGDIVMFEHQGAIANATQSTSAESKSGIKKNAKLAQGTQNIQLQSVLVDAVDVKIVSHSFILILKSGGKAVVQMEVTRGDLHRFLALLRQKCDEANWCVAIQASWLDLDAGSMTLN